MKSWDIGKCACPHCGTIMRYTTEASGDNDPPKPGDLSVCFTCLTTNQFADAGEDKLKIVEFDMNELEPEDRQELEETLRKLASSRPN